MISVAGRMQFGSIFLINDSGWKDNPCRSSNGGSSCNCTSSNVMRILATWKKWRECWWSYNSSGASDSNSIRSCHDLNIGADHDSLIPPMTTTQGESTTMIGCS